MPGRRTLAGRFLLFSLVINSLLLIVLGGTLTMLSGNVMQSEVTASCERMLLQTKRLIDTYFSDARTTGPPGFPVGCDCVHEYGEPPPRQNPGA